ncbi:MAG: hypothetical protein ACI85I_002728 [Arenicella sp.]|jgi:hypothetical protein
MYPEYHFLPQNHPTYIHYGYGGFFSGCFGSGIFEISLVKLAITLPIIIFLLIAFYSVAKDYKPKFELSKPFYINSDVLMQNKHVYWEYFGVEEAPIYYAPKHSFALKSLVWVLIIVTMVTPLAFFL